jgi:hypothetical protein
MKVKYLVHKETKEFIEVTTMGGTPMVFTCVLPHMPMNADKSNDEILDYLKTENPTINFDDYEVVEFDLVQSGVIGADIRNKLSPIKNMIAIIENADVDPLHAKFLKHDIEQSKISVEYLKNLL